MPHPPVEPLGKVRTKIVATLGPASSDPETLRRLAEAGADLFRLNASHGTHAEHAARLAAVRRVGDELDRPIGVLIDLGGPKIRLGPIAGDEVECRLGDEFRLTAAAESDDPRVLTSTYRGLAGDLTPGDPVLFADGAVAMEVASASGGEARLVVTGPGRIRSKQGINLPGAELKVGALTEKDLSDLDWVASHPVEYLGLSFARSPDDVTRLRRELVARKIAARIVTKIEKPQAVARFDAILAESDAIMVARGDLGVEMDVARVPAIQKQIIAKCHRARVPVITATQMLASMETSPRPTRAEATDVFNAILDGTDAVMLSGETAVGAYPVEAVATMSRIAAEAEALVPPSALSPSAAAPAGHVSPITEALVEAASLACRKLSAALVVVATHSGRTALALSKQRHPTPTLALTDSPDQARALSLYWGVTPAHFPEITDAEHALQFALTWARDRGLVAPGDRVVLVRGTMPGSAVHNALLVQEVT